MEQPTYQWMQKYTVSYRILDHLSKEFVNIKSHYPNCTSDEIFNQGLTFKTISWYEVIIPILGEIYPDNKHQDIGRNIEERIYGGKVWLNPKYKNKFVEDILHFNFTRLFPEVIWNLYRKGDIKFNNNRIGDLLGDLLNITVKDIEYYVKNRAGIKIAFNYKEPIINEKSQISFNGSAEPIFNTISNTNENYLTDVQNKIIQEIKMFKKIVINYFYGLISNPKNEIFYCDDFNIIPKYCHNLFNIVIEKFKDDIVYLDTDEIYFRYSKNLMLQNFKKILEMTELPYDFENGHEKLGNVFSDKYGGHTFPYNHNSLYDGIFTDVKHYTLFNKDSHLIKKCGYITYKEDTGQNYLNNKINKYYKNIKID